MKKFQLLVLMVFSLNALGQTSVYFSTLSGYESNINRAPELLEQNGELLEGDDLFLNSYYQDFAFNFRYSKSWRQNVLRFYITPEYRSYFSEPEVNQTIFTSRIYHKYSFRSKSSLETSFQFKIKDRAGQNLDQNELNLPFGYRQFTLNSTYKYRLFKQNRSYVRLNLGNKKFNNSDSRSINYNFYGITSEFKIINWVNHLLHAYGAKIGLTNRDYRITNFSDNSNGDRIWRYFDASLFYRYPLNKKVFIEPRLSFQSRSDVTNSVFGYRQLRPEVLFQFKSNDWIVKINTSYSNRNFDAINASNEDGDPNGNLQFKYWRLRSNIDYSINKRLKIISEVSILDRNSNNLDITTSGFRTYSNNYYGIGLRYSF